MSLLLFLGFLIKSLIDEQKDSGYIINLSGKQRMLSQKTILYAKEYFISKNQHVLNQYKSLINIMEKENEILVKHLLNNYSFDIYNNVPNIKKSVEDYLALHKKFITSLDQQDLNNIFLTSQELLKILDFAVTYHEKYLVKKVDDLILCMGFVFAMIVLLIIFEYLFIFNPLLKSNNKINRDLKDKIKDLKIANKTANMGQWKWLFNTDIIETSEEFRKIYGLKNNKVFTNEDLLKLIHKEDKEKVINVIKEAFSKKEANQTIYRILVDGKIKYIQVIWEIGFNKDGDAYCFNGSSQDITELKEQELKLKDLNENLEDRVKEKTKKLNQALEDINEAQAVGKIGTWVFDIKNNHLKWSKEIFNIFNLDMKKFKPSYEKFFELIHPDDSLMVREANEQSLIDKKPYEIKHRLLFEDKTIKWVLEKCETVFDEEGKPLVSKGIIQDITIQEEAQIQNQKSESILINQSKNAMMGEMLANIAHQWRQPLNQLSLKVQKLKFDFKKEKVNQEYVESFINENKFIIKYLSQTIDDFRNFFEPDKKKENFNLVNCIDSALKIVNAVLEDNFIKLNVKIELNNVTVFGYKNEFQQVLINIINNAKDAINHNNVENRTIDLELIANKTEVILIISDYAGGIPKDIIEKIFMPYFTTKFESQGTGLGLHMSKQIIELNMSGKLEVENKNGGARFLITLPLIENGDLESV